MADEKRAGPWVEDQGEWVRRLQDPSQFAAWVFYSPTQERWSWHASVAAMGHAPTPDTARAAADEALRAEGWVLEPAGASEHEVALRVMTDIWPELERAARESEPPVEAGVAQAWREAWAEALPPGVVRVSHGTVDPPKPLAAPVVAIIRRWAADRDAGRAIGEGAEVLLDELLEAVGTGRPDPRDMPIGPLVDLAARMAATRAVATGGSGGVSPNALPVAPPATEARGRLVAGAWVERVNGDWVRSSPDPTRDAARVWEARAWGASPAEWWWRWAASGAGDEMPTPEAARQAADAALRAAGWELTP